MKGLRIIVLRTFLVETSIKASILIRFAFNKFLNWYQDLQIAIKDFKAQELVHNNDISLRGGAGAAVIVLSMIFQIVLCCFLH